MAGNNARLASGSASILLGASLSLPAVVRTSTTWLLRNTLTSGDPTATFTYGCGRWCR